MPEGRGPRNFLAAKGYSPVISLAQVGEPGSEPDPSGPPVEDLRLLGHPFVTADGADYMCSSNPC